MKTPAIFGILMWLCLCAPVVASADAGGILPSQTPQDGQQNPSPTPPTSGTAGTQGTVPDQPGSTKTQATPGHAASQTEGSAQSRPTPPHAKKPKKPAHKTDASAETGSNKTVVRDGGTADPTVSLSPGISQQEASRFQDTQKLLDASTSNLRQLAGRQLTSSQQDTVKQVRNYMDQAAQAEKSGDLQRAHNLAYNAQLLSAELAGQ